jgi:AsmA protein
MKREFRILGIVGIIVAIAIVGLIAAPFFIDVNRFRPEVEAQLTNALGRQVKIGQLHMSLLSGTVRADDLSIADDPSFSRTPFVQAKSLKIGVALMPLIFSRAIHVTSVTLQQPQIELLQSKSGNWNFSILGGSKSVSEAPAKSENASMAGLSVKKLNIRNGRLSVGQAPAQPRVYENVNIEVKNFSATSKFPFTMSAKLPGNGDLKLAGEAGPISATDTALTPLSADVAISHLDIAALGGPSASLAGLADFAGHVTSDGKSAHATGTMQVAKLKLSPKGHPAARSVEVKYEVTKDLETRTGVLQDATVSVAQAVAHVTGAYHMQDATTILNLKVNGQNMPVDDLEAMLPALGIELPSGSSLKGGMLTVALNSNGPLSQLITTGSFKLTNTKLSGFDLGSKMSGIASLLGNKTGSNTSIQSFSSNFRATPEGIQNHDIDLVVPAMGQVTGDGSISPSNTLNYKMTMKLAAAGSGGSGLLEGVGALTGDIPFSITGTAANPTFSPDLSRMAEDGAKSLTSAKGLGRLMHNGSSGVVNGVESLFGKK